MVIGKLPVRYLLKLVRKPLNQPVQPDCQSSERSREGPDRGATSPATTCSPTSTGSDSYADTRDVNKTRSPSAPGSARAL
jgi:hypothetical protein